MTARDPTILATSGGYRTPDFGDRELTPLVHCAAELSGAEGKPKVCHIPTANGDQHWMSGIVAEAGQKAGFDWCTLHLFAEPTVKDVEGLVLDQDVIWVNGGSVVNLLAVWRAHGLERILRRAWEAGVVLAGISAGSLCWFRGGPTDSFGPPLRTITNGLGFLPYGNGVHYDGEPGRRPRVHEDVRRGVFDEVHCTDDGAGMIYR
ncbi:MAG: peptidase E, partial [Brachybacterium sp.]|nr:peptidase E [Brachybacterium sp.]